MSEPARKRVPDDEAVPVAISHDEKTIETATTAVPDLAIADDVTVPVKSSLEKIFRHEMLRQRSRRDDGDR